MKGGLSLVKNVLTPLTRSGLISLQITAAATKNDSGIHKKCLSISFFCIRNNNTNYIKTKKRKTFLKKSLEDSGLLTQTI